jgi:MFS transporter, DHA3 family, multidrug efflux protein
MVDDAGSAHVKTFHRLVVNTLIASVTNNFLWFALTFWVYLETRSVVASSVIGGSYMLLLSASALYFGTYVDHHRRKSSMLASSGGSLAAYLLAAMLYVVAPEGSLQDLGHPAFWVLVVLVLGGAIGGNLRSVALSTTVTLLVPEDSHDKANGLVGTVNGVAFAITSVFSGLAIGFLGMGWSIGIAVALTMLAAAHLGTIRIEGDRAGAEGDQHNAVDIRGAFRAVRAAPGLLLLLFFTTFNNFLGGVFMALMDPYGLTLVSVETWGLVLGAVSFGFIAGGFIVARKGLGSNPPRTLLVANAALWTICVLFPVRSSIVLLVIGFVIYTALIPVVEASEQTIIQRVVPFEEQGRVFGFAQMMESGASPITAFLVGPIAQVWVIPFMTDGAGADSVGSWFGTGPDRGMALVFIAAGLIGLVATIGAMRSRGFDDLSSRYAASSDESDTSDAVQTGGAAPSAS